MCHMRKIKGNEKKIKKHVRMTSGKGGSGEKVSHFWDHSVDAIKRRKRKGKMKENKEMRKREKRENEMESKKREECVG